MKNNTWKIIAIVTIVLLVIVGLGYMGAVKAASFYASQENNTKIGNGATPIK